MATVQEEQLVLNGKNAWIEIDRSSGCFSIYQRDGKKAWSSDPWLNAAGILVLESPQGARHEINISKAQEITIDGLSDQAASLRFARFPLENGDVIEAELLTRISLAQNGEAFRVEVLDVRLPAKWVFSELEYPARLGALRTDVDQGYLVIPNRQGTLIPSTIATFNRVPRVAFWAWDDGPWTDRGCQDLQVYGHTQITMPFYGIVDGDSSLACILETENDAYLRCVLNSNYQQFFNRTMQMSPYSRLAACSPVWKSELRAFGYARSMLFSILPNGDFVSMAKHYRAYARETGLAVTLNEKIAENPNIDAIIGGPFIQMDGAYPWYIDYPIYRYTWADARLFVDWLKNKLKLPRALLCLWVGYQNYPPESWPFHPAQGTLDELKSLIQYARERNILICFYHGYPSLLDHDPHRRPERARQNTPQGNMASRWGRHCSHYYKEYAERNLPPTIRDSGLVADYTDILTSTNLGECYSSEHGHSRTKDRQNKVETLAYINSLGLFTGSEHLQGYAVPVSCYSKGGNVGGGGDWIMGQYSVPLWNLVFHDCYIAYDGLMSPGAGAFQSFAAGCHNQLFFNWPHFQLRKDGNWEDLSAFYAFQRATGREELLDYRYEDELNGPYQAIFGDGSKALVNATMESREVAGELLAPESMVLKFADGRRVSASSTHPEWQIQQS